MLRHARLIGRLSKFSVNLHNAPKLTGITKISHVNYKHSDAIGNSKETKKTGVTATFEECAPKPEKKAQKLPACEDPNYICPPDCIETCNTSSDGSKPPCGGGSTWDNVKTYWKQLLASVLVTGVAIYMVNKNYTNTSKIGDLITEDSPKETKKKKSKKIVQSPPFSTMIPEKIPYLLIGGGTAAFSAFRSIKSKDPTAKVLVITSEPHLPYMRPPLSKELWYTSEKDASKNLIFKQWNGDHRSLFYEPSEFYMDIRDLAESEKGGVSVATGWKIKKVDAINKVAILEDGYKIKYDKCLIATGGSPKTLPVFDSASDEVKRKIIEFRTVDDFLDLQENLSKQSVKNIVIVGGGFLGSELAFSLVRNIDKNQKMIHQLVKEKSIMAQILPEYLSDWLTQKLLQEGIHCLPNVEIEDYVYKNGKLTLTLTGGKTLDADQVIVAVGVEPNTELSVESNLEVDPEIGGFLVNAELQARTDLWVAGDAACFYDVRLGRRRVEHHDHAVISGRLAGENMTGAGKPYLHQSMFWSDLGPEIGYEAIGIVDSTLRTVGVFAKFTDKDNDKIKKLTDEDKTPENNNSNGKSSSEIATVNMPNESKEDITKAVDDFKKGVIFYLRDNIIVGIVLWNIFNRMSVARQVLAQGIQYDDLNEVAKLFAIHED